jgi:hypothetical protein
VSDNNLFFALSNSAPGKDAEFNDWYDKHHIREVPETHLGFLSGRRFRLNQGQPANEAGVGSPWQYLAIYQLDPAIDPAAIHKDGREHRGRTVPAGDTLADDHVAWTWEPVGHRLLRRSKNPLPGGTQHVLLELTNPADGQETDFDHWRSTHIPETLEHTPGSIAAQPYQLAAGQREDQWKAAVPGRDSGDDVRLPNQWLPWRYLTLYELEGDDTTAVGEAGRRAEASTRQATADRHIAPAHAVWLFTALPDPSWQTPTPRTPTGVEATSRSAG